MAFTSTQERRQLEPSLDVTRMPKRNGDQHSLGRLQVTCSQESFGYPDCHGIVFRRLLVRRFEVAQRSSRAAALEINVTSTGKTRVATALGVQAMGVSRAIVSRVLRRAGCRG